MVSKTNEHCTCPLTLINRKPNFFFCCFDIFRFYDDEEGESEGGASEEERAFRWKLIADEFAKRRKV